uniref:Uncharacterized protein n=1 Tax=Arundo donax TaxID=35708 RepID=A0A0A9HX87_ARUDO
MAFYSTASTCNLPLALGPGLFLQASRYPIFPLSSYWPLFHRWQKFEAKVHFGPLGLIREGPR